MIRLFCWSQLGINKRPWRQTILFWSDWRGNAYRKQKVKTQEDQDKENPMATMNRYALSLPFVFYKKKVQNIAVYKFHI